jgi:hypothetical protein
MAKRARAQRRYNIAGATCENCGVPATDRHHIDGDTGNNDRSNIAILCRRCHMAADGRAVRLAEMRIVPKAARPCRICLEIRQRYLRKGRCIRCERYLRRHGVERPRVAKIVRAVAFGPCMNCSTKARLRKKRCPHCYDYFQRTAQERPRERWGVILQSGQRFTSAKRDSSTGKFA